MISQIVKQDWSLLVLTNTFIQLEMNNLVQDTTAHLL